METIEEQLERAQTNDIRVGDFIKSRTLGLAMGYVTGQGILNRRAYWLIRDVHSRKDVIEKEDAVMLGFGVTE